MAASDDRPVQGDFFESAFGRKRAGSFGELGPVALVIEGLGDLLSGRRGRV